jgi:hypothetical protein
MSEWGTAAQRIGDEERAAAVAALDAHRQSGRLDPAEFEERQVAVSRARTWGDVAPLFTDLPAPHPVGMPTGLPSVPPVHSAPEPYATPGGYSPPVPPSGLLGGVVPERYRTTVMALTPFAAVLLFFVTHTWIWFLAIPIMGILLYGPDGKNERRRDRRSDRYNR